MKKIVVTVLVLFLLIGVAAGYVYANYNVDNILAGNTEIKTETYQWELHGDTAVITGIGSLQLSEIVIPAQIYLTERDGDYIEDPLQGSLYQVCVRGDAFAECANIRTVMFGDGVTIENNQMSMDHKGMFSECKNLISVHNIPNSVINMAYTFSGCSALKDVERLPSSVVDLTQCFYSCTALEVAPAIPQSVTSISECFLGCTSLRSVGEITAVAGNFDKVFYNCTSLEIAPILPNTVSSMRYCFYGCTALVEVSQLPSELLDLTEAFADCTSLVEFQAKIPDKATDLTRAFTGCTSLSHFAYPLPDSAQILTRTFADCSSLIAIPGGIPSNATNLDYTFYNCTSLTKLDGEFPETITSMYATFSGCKSLESIPTMPIEILYLHNSKDTKCFEKCASLREIIIDHCTNLHDTRYSFRNKLVFLKEHIPEGICTYCKYVNGTFAVDGLDVYFMNIPFHVYEECLSDLQNCVPQEIKDSNFLLSIVQYKDYPTYLQSLCNQLNFYYESSMEGTEGYNFTRYSKSYATVRLKSSIYANKTAWLDHDFYVMVHELAHGYDFTTSPKPSQTYEWIKIHEAEQHIIQPRFYDDSYLSLYEYDRREETYAMATAAYFHANGWLQENCPQMYAYMDALWGTE